MPSESPKMACAKLFDYIKIQIYSSILLRSPPHPQAMQSVLLHCAPASLPHLGDVLPILQVGFVLQTEYQLTFEYLRSGEWLQQQYGILIIAMAVITSSPQSRRGRRRY
jgi:hypothetical protein